MKFVPVGTGGLAVARSRSGENDYQSFSNTLAPLRYLDCPFVTGGLAVARSRLGENDYQSFSNTLAPLRYLDGPFSAPFTHSIMWI